MKEYKLVKNSYSKGNKIIIKNEYVILGFDYLGDKNLCRVELANGKSDIVPINKQNKILINGKWTKRWHH